MQDFNSPEQDPSGQEAAEQDPLARFRTWRGFLFAAIALNVLFVYGMLAGVSDPRVGGWVKALSWLPFNVIASVLYYVFLTKLSRAGAECAQAGTHAALYAALCIAMIIANWIALFAA